MHGGISIKLWAFLSARKLLEIVFFLLVIKSLIKSNYPKSTFTHSEPPNHTFPKNSNRIPKEFLKNSDRILKEFNKKSKSETPNHKSPKNSQKNSQKIQHLHKQAHTHTTKMHNVLK